MHNANGNRGETETETETETGEATHKMGAIDVTSEFMKPIAAEGVSGDARQDWCGCGCGCGRAPGRAERCDAMRW